ncbi:MAG: hypothetical protein AAF730_12560 [Bacteroidota bacterium]
MFDLNTAVATWRRDLDRTTKLPRTALDELEDHLLGDIDIQMEDGVEPERAYLEAVARLGQPKALQREFEKNSQGKRWLFAGARLGGAGYILHEALMPSVDWMLAVLAMTTEETTATASGLGGALQTLAAVLQEIGLMFLFVGELMVLIPIAVIALVLTLRQRQRGWAVTFGMTLLAVPLMLNNMSGAVFSIGSLLMVVLLVTSLFTVYPPSLPDALERRLRRA